VDLHMIYKVAFTAASTPNEFMKLWSKKNTKVVVGLLEKSILDLDTRKRLVEAFKAWRRTIEIRMDNARRFHEEQKVKTFLDDPNQYRFLSNLFKANRVFAIRGDLTGKNTLRGIGEIAKKMNLPVRVLYLSNAERYFDYSDDFRQNIQSMPFDGRSIILRTAGLGSWANGDPFYYLYQNADNYLLWLNEPTISHVKKIVKHRIKQSVRFLYSIEDMPTPEPDDPPSSTPSEQPKRKPPTEKSQKTGRADVSVNPSRGIQ
jgi:hypothetical protein